MRSAKRLEKIPPYLFSEIARAKAKALAEGKDLVDLGIGDPDQPTPQPIIDRLCRAASTPVTHRYDETPWGWQEFIEAAAAWMKRRFGVEVDPGGEILLLIELVGTSSESWEQAARNAVETAMKSLKDIRIAEVSKLDMQIEEGKILAYRARVTVSFKYHVDMDDD